MSRRQVTFWNTRNTAITGLILTIPFIILAFMVAFNQATLDQIDFNLGSLLHNLRTSFRSEIALGITTVGDAWSQATIGLIITSLLLSLKKFKAALWYSLTMIIGALLLNGAAKAFFGRARPDNIEALVQETTFSFPSGHAMGSIILFGGLAFLVCRMVRKEKFFKGLVIFFCLVTVLAIGLSRVYLGVHYPSDVIGGFSLGAAWLFLSISAYGLRATN